MKRQAGTILDHINEFRTVPGDKQGPEVALTAGLDAEDKEEKCDKEVYT